MKKIFSGKWAVALMACAALMLACPKPAKAQGQSFQTTNQITAATSILGFPTNSVGTNGIGVGTGGYVEVKNYTEIGLELSGTNLVNTNAAGYNLGITLLRSGADSPPADSSQWETTSAAALSFVVPVPAASNGFYWFTNLTTTDVGAATYVGIYTVTNKGGPGTILTNFNLRVIKKVKPIKFP